MTKGSTRVPPIITPVWVCGRAGWFQAMFGQNGGVSFINRRSALIGSVTGGASEGCRRLAKDDEQAKPENGQNARPPQGQSPELAESPQRRLRASEPGRLCQGGPQALALVVASAS